MLAEVMVSMAIAMSPQSKVGCEHLYPYSKQIQIKAKELCNSWYVSRYDETNRRVIFVSEILDAKTVQTERNSNFIADIRVKNAVRSSEYNRTGYDRGHLAPAGDASNEQEMFESFFMTNVVPQAPKLNRGEWKKLETRIRNKAGNDPIHIITGAIYHGDSMPGFITVPVPTAVYKIVYFKSDTEYWYAENKDTAKVVRVTKSQLERIVGYAIP